MEGHAASSNASAEFRRDTVTAESNPANKRKRGTSEAVSFQCQICQRSFGRVEHLRRHTVSHSEERSFQCEVCPKSFNRLDTLRRHELMHKKGESVAKSKKLRACKECATTKTRCSGSQPCERCSAKAVECIYPRLSSPEGSNTTSERSTMTPFPGPPPSAPIAELQSVVRSSQPPAAAGYAQEHVVYPVQTPGTADSSTRGYWSTGSSTTNWLPDGFSPAFIPQFSTPQAHPMVATPTSGGQTVDSDLTNVHANSSANKRWLETVIGEGRKAPGDPPSSSSSSHAAAGTGHFYVDGEGGRLARTGRYRRASARMTASTAASAGPPTSLKKRQFGFSHIDDGRAGSRTKPFSRMELLTHDTYTVIREQYVSLCLTPSPYFPAFESSIFPSRDVLNGFLQLYLEFFQPLMPVLHVPTVDLNGQWFLALALATIGCHFADLENVSDNSTAFNEFLRRAVLAVDSEDEIDKSATIHATLCSCVGLMYSGDEVWQKVARSQLTEVIHLAHAYYGADQGFDYTGLAEDHHVDAKWNAWVTMESGRRTRYAIWLLDAMWAYQFQYPPLLALECGKYPLPCQEVLFEAETALQWRHVFGYSPLSPTLVSAIHSIYIDKRLQSTMGEFSRIILIHALYHRNWEVEHYFKQPLSSWLPTADRPEVRVSEDPIWLPRVPVVSRWRNATCDCLDIMHWSANSIIGAASGMEHPTVCHLHLSRVILLTPFREIHSMALGLTKEDKHITNDQILNHRRIICCWALQDRHKARLAMIHAGVLLWHVRRYSANGFYEPNAVLLATLALWAYGTFSDAQSEPEPAREADPSDDESYPTAINLDRPADDELVQTFIKRGDQMQALITGVGDIRGPEGPGKVLLEGSRLVSQLHNWGTSRKAMRVLNNLSLCRNYSNE